MTYCSPNGPIKETLEKKNIPYIGIDKLNVKNIKKVINEFNPDLIHAHDYRASIIAARSGFNGKIISHLHYNSPFAKSWNLKTILYGLTTKKYNAVVGVSNKVYEEAIFKKMIKDKYITLYNCVDKDSIITKANKEEVSLNYDLFYIGRLSEPKNPLEFIEIINEVRKVKDDIKAVMIGDGDLKEECVKYINNYNLNNNITLLGFIENPFPIIKNCKIGIMPSKWEGFGLTAIESIVLGKPVLNSGVGGLGEIFKINKEFVCKNVKDYSSKALELLENKNVKNVNIEEYLDKYLWKEKLSKIYK